MNGAFKAYAVSSGLKADLDTDDRTARLYFKVIPEPRLNDFQYQAPYLLSAEDNKLNRYSSEKNRSTYWQRIYSSQMDFTDEYSVVEIALPSTEATAFTHLSIAVPVRFVLTTHKVHLDAPGDKEESSLSHRDGIFTLKALQGSKNSVSAHILIEGKGRKNLSYDSFDYFLEQKGERIGSLRLRSVTSSVSNDSFSFECKLRGDMNKEWKPDMLCQVLITWPDETMEEQLRFDFKDIVLP
jgi:hypothetical protein